LCEGGDLITHLEKFGQWAFKSQKILLASNESKRILLQVLLGLQVLHTHGILHLDIKVDTHLLSSPFSCLENTAARLLLFSSPSSHLPLPVKNKLNATATARQHHVHPKYNLGPTRERD
jgi:serine/threonine protein kinase